MDRELSTQMLTRLVETHHTMLYRYAYRLSGSAVDADDLTQQTYLIAQTKLDQLRDETRAGGWLCAILRNLFLKDQREVQKFPVVSLSDLATPAETPAETSAVEREIPSDVLQQSLNNLPEEFRTPLILFYFDELGYRQIADLMGIPLGTVMSRLSRGKKQLRKELLHQQPLIEQQLIE